MNAANELEANLDQMSKKDMIEYAVSAGWDRSTVTRQGRGKLLKMLLAGPVSEMTADQAIAIVEHETIPAPVDAVADRTHIAPMGETEHAHVPPTLVAEGTTEHSKKVRNLTPMATTFQTIRRTKIDGMKIVGGFVTVPKGGTPAATLEQQAEYCRTRASKIIGAVIMLNGKGREKKIFILCAHPNREVEMTNSVTKVLDAAGMGYEVESVESGPQITLA